MAWAPPSSDEAAGPSIAIVAAVRRRRRCDLYHSALEVIGTKGRYAIEMAPVADHYGERRGVVAGGAVGAKLFGRLRIFRYEIRRSLDGAVPDRDVAVGGPVAVSSGGSAVRGADGVAVAGQLSSLSMTRAAL